MSKSMRRVLVTGATGFLGRNVLSALLRREDVIPIAACRQPQKLPSGFRGEVRCGDLRDATYRRDVTKNVDVICHTGTWASLWNHAELEQRNLLACGGSSGTRHRQWRAAIYSYQYRSHYHSSV